MLEYHEAKAVMEELEPFFHLLAERHDLQGVAIQPFYNGQQTINLHWVDAEVDKNLSGRIRGEDVLFEISARSKGAGYRHHIRRIDVVPLAKRNTPDWEKEVQAVLDRLYAIVGSWTKKDMQKELEFEG